MKVFCLLFFVPAFLAAQESPAVEFSPSPVRADQRFTLTFEIPHPEAEDVRVPYDVRFPASIVLLGGPAIFPVLEKDPRSGIVDRRVKVQYVFRAARPGRVVIDPIPYTVAGTAASTRPRILEIAFRSGPALVPFDLVWRTSVPRLYEGQTAAVFLEMRNLKAITVPESFSVSPPAGTLFEEAKGLGTIQTQRIGREELYRIPVASYLLTPSAPGRILVPEAKVKAGGLTVASESLLLEVQPVPEEVRPTGAVGKFLVSSSLERTEIPLGSQVRLSFRVEGEGNLNYLQLPEVVLEDGVVAGKSVRPSLVPTEKGYRGFMQWDLRLSPRRAGDLKVQVPTFPWFDAETGEVSSSLAKTLLLRVSERKEVKAAKEAKLRLLEAEEIFGFSTFDAYKRPYVYVLLLPGCLGFVLLGLRKRKEGFAVLFVVLFLLGAAPPEGEKGQRETAEEGVKAYKADKFGLAIEKFSLLPKSPGVHYNLGIAHKGLGNIAPAVFHLRKAVEMNPGVALFRESLGVVEGEYGLQRQTPLPRLHPDLFLWALFGFFFGAGLFPLVLKRRGLRFILSVFCFVGAGLALVGLVYESSDRDVRQGVIGPKSVELRKIPLPSSSEWLFLEEGTAVKIIGASESYVLVKTGFGVEGWVEKTRLLTE